LNDGLNRSLILGHEGRRFHAYPDSRGFTTIADGFNLMSTAAPAICAKFGIDYHAVLKGAPITPAQCDQIFDYNYGQVVEDLTRLFPHLAVLPDNLAAVLCDMRFELGYAGFRGFHDFLSAVRVGNWPQAVAAMWDSDWAKEVPTRVKNDASLLEAIKL
jgi:GH24 family phage-related lysozyme (muramidase)